MRKSHFNSPDISGRGQKFILKIKTILKPLMNIRNLTNAPILTYPDFRKPFHIVIGASNIATGVALLQDSHHIEFYSITLNSAEKNSSKIIKNY